MRLFRLSAFAFAILFMASCDKDEAHETTSLKIAPVQFENRAIDPLDGREPLSQEALYDYAKMLHNRKGDLLWTWYDDYTLWSAVKQSPTPLMALGYKLEDMPNEFEEGQLAKINVQDPEWKATREALLRFIEEELGQTRTSFLEEVDKTLPVLLIKSDDYELIAKLRRAKTVRYLEPLDYDLFAINARSTSGCGGSSKSILTSDYSTTAPNNAKIPWNYWTMNIPQAWSKAQGDNITVGVIDAGFSNNQSALTYNFDSGYSTGRNASFYATYGNSPYNTCTHGTSMAGIVAAPRTNLGNAIGVAYKADLIGVRACDDVVLNKSSERRGVKNALISLANTSNLKVISMSIGWVFGASYLKDGVNYARDRGVLVFAAGGTSTSFTTWAGVIYPARYDATVAVTGVRENNSRCDVCHWGSKIDFTVTMERNNDYDRHTLSLKPSGNTPSYVGGSSCATATMAGIAALTWSAKPSLSRAQVLQVLKESAEYYPSRNSNRGYGRINANTAVTKALTR